MRSFGKWNLKFGEKKRGFMRKEMTRDWVYNSYICFLFLLLCWLLLPEIGNCSVETIISNTSKSISVLFPTLAALALLWASINFLKGHENAKDHLTKAIIGCFIAFGATSIVSFVQGIVGK